MNHFTFSAILCFVFCLVSGLFFIAKQDRSSRLFGIFWLTVSFWCSFVGFQFNLLNVMPHFWWGWLLHFGCIMVPVVFMHFALVFSGALQRSGMQNFLKLGYWIAAVFLLLILFSNWFTAEIAYRDTLNYPRPSFLYPVYIVFFQVMGLVGTLALFQMRKALSPEKRKWLYVYLVVHLFAHAGAMDNYLIMYDVRIFPLYPYGLYMILPYVVLGSIAFRKIRH
ncbi:MAG: hypothetical protein A3G33_00975 [Omnitrophica bacterium RIFCSPLOWO2_12_FULL_44_17]|uniref:Histidine kinase N-terminal 7TM region domain-containing protein n=1 Tax=Candidatus Danuiimicrobium aquiferis TaxID=1801832 RepID=A0A1G1L2W4_9BACT|nr:MAG: hypothetical protein A3B72_06525 [Omnitrophica bacterium RIFCSPHIGHO2_02_FULL_45_28]OGW89666.1 MAG: hypothetical protein A3E74_04715 [Omnitrophica bacterium RIFCSPHIGHO2_12_FULL_44_12]OGW99476.1 MAG: hypothetical protein A3G33_00975 [Omnitrophica bacterium RIFCSPLOWO2_12_FULL_44_17]OGX04312.1 MAG: hypothetical protein A3J12_00685 [Omnitrophica bacterium RIFCSPLOWO2_02_FULL_44_11]